MNLGFEKIRVVYYTDPICSTCWAFEPYLNKFLNEYSFFIDFEIRMGGLLEDWDSLRQIEPEKSNSDYLEQLWLKESNKHGIHLESDIWKFSPIKSSYLVSEAFCAIQMQSADKAFVFLKFIRDFVFLLGKDPNEQALINTCAMLSKIDFKKFRIDLNSGEAKNKFLSQLAERKKDKVHFFPSFVIENSSGERRTLLDIPSYNSFYEVLSKLEGYLNELTDGKILKKNSLVNPLDILKKYELLTISELIVLSGQKEMSIQKVIDKAYNDGLLIKEKYGTTNYWKWNQTPYRFKKANLDSTSAIIGGGICGSFLSSALTISTMKAVTYERKGKLLTGGIGFLLLQNGIEALDSIGCKPALYKKGNPINFFRAIRPDGTPIFEKTLNDCVAISRVDLCNILENQSNEVVEKECVKLIDSNGLNQAAFKDGSTTHTDMLFVTDGIKSKIRKQLFPAIELTEVHEREIVCLVNVPGLKMQKDLFLKVINIDTGKGIGFIPLGNDNYIWFLQFNNDLDPIEDSEVETLKKFSLQSADGFPDYVQQIIEASDFNNAFLWTSKRMDLLPKFHDKNAVLLGDAAHPLLALTSQGANSALEDAAIMVSLLSNKSENESLEEIFQEFYDLRKDVIAHYIKEGDLLAADFHDLSANKNFKLPLSIH
ncbi:MAG: DsbA family protein [Flavobacteriia bacterium]